MKKLCVVGHILLLMMVIICLATIVSCYDMLLHGRILFPLFTLCYGCSVVLFYDVD